MSSSFPHYSALSSSLSTSPSAALGNGGGLDALIARSKTNPNPRTSSVERGQSPTSRASNGNNRSGRGTSTSRSPARVAAATTKLTAVEGQRIDEEERLVAPSTGLDIRGRTSYGSTASADQNHLGAPRTPKSSRRLSSSSAHSQTASAKILHMITSYPKATSHPQSSVFDDTEEDEGDEEGTATQFEPTTAGPSTTIRTPLLKKASTTSFNGESGVEISQEEIDLLEGGKASWSTFKSVAKSEFLILCLSTIPIWFTQLAEYSLVLASVISIGHLSTTDLAACSLGSMTAGVTCFSILSGMASALDTLLPVAWTSEDPTRVGLWTQRMAVVMTVTCFPIYMVWYNAEGLLLFLRQDPEVAARAALYLKALSLGIPAYGGNQIMRKYLQSQNLLSVPTRIMLIVAPINAFMNWLLVWGPDPVRFGFIGAPIATAISYNLNFLLSILYASFFCPKTAWGGWSAKGAFSKLGTVTSLGLAGTGMMSSEWWSWEIIALAASLLGPISLASQSILLSTTSGTYQAPYALSMAASVRVGNLLGAAKAYEARVSAQMGLLLSIIIAGANSTLLTVCRKNWAYIYNSDEEVVTLVAQVLPLVAFFQLFDGLCGVAGGVLRSLGKQTTGALINLSSYYIFGLPIGIYATFHYHMGLEGLWGGLSLALIYGSFFTVLLVWKTDYIKASILARERVSGGAPVATGH